jgi:hypothetical protein
MYKIPIVPHLLVRMVEAVAESLREARENGK